MVGGKIGEKNDQKKSSRETKPISDSRLVNGSASTGKDDDDNDGTVLKDNTLNNYDACNFVPTEGGNEEVV